MAFATEAITLTSICDAYSVSKNMNALRGKSYYTTSGTSFTIPSTGAINMNEFRGKYRTVLTGTIESREASGENASRYDWGFGYTVTNSWVIGRVGFDSASFTIAGNTLISLTVNFYQQHSHGAAAVSSDNNSPNVYIKLDGVTISSSIGTHTFTLNCTSTLELHAWSQASNNVGQQTSQGGSWNYTISSTGLTYTGFVNGY